MTSSLENIVIDWMSNKGAPEWHGVAVNWNWDYGVKPLLWIVDQPECDKATALTVFWLSEPLYEMDEKRRGEHPKDDTYELVHRILDNWKRYRTARFSFQLPYYVQHIHSEKWRLSKECLETLQPLMINIDGQERYPTYDLSIPAECYIKHKEQNGEPVTDHERDHLARERAGKNMSLTNEEVAAVQQKELEKSWSEWFDTLNDMVDTVEKHKRKGE